MSLSLSGSVPSSFVCYMKTFANVPLFLGCEGRKGGHRTPLLLLLRGTLSDLIKRGQGSREGEKKRDRGEGWMQQKGERQIPISLFLSFAMVIAFLPLLLLLLLLNALDNGLPGKETPLSPLLLSHAFFPKGMSAIPSMRYFLDFKMF